SPVDKKALLRKMDIRLIPWMSFLYFLSFLNRSSIRNARVQQDIHMTDNQYLTTLTIFYIMNLLFHNFRQKIKVPSNIILKRLRPSIWLPACMTAWDICMVCSVQCKLPILGSLTEPFF
ncbi:hypothetical protein M422DRAFT_150349, partial [Sphaerobolus stellatus SS14]